MWELTELAGGVAVVLLPLFLLAVPFAVMLVPLAAVALVAAVLAAPVLLMFGASGR